MRTRPAPRAHSARSTTTDDATAQAAFAALRASYPQALERTALRYAEPYQLVAAVILSAQCTDARVNAITPPLFARFSSVEALARATPRAVEPFVRTAGLFRNKARHLVGMARALVVQHGGRVPNDRDALLALPGVGRKTANVVLSVLYDIPALAVDTHVGRVARRLGWSAGKTPEAIERDLCERFAPELWNPLHRVLITHGREVCAARAPRCAACAARALCPTGRD